MDRRTRITPAAAGTRSPTPPGSRGEHMPYVSPPVPQNTLNRGIKNYSLRSETTEPRRQCRLIFQHSGEQVGCCIRGEKEWEQLVGEPAVVLPAGPPLQELPLNGSRGIKGSVATSLLRAGRGPRLFPSSVYQPAVRCFPLPSAQRWISPRLSQGFSLHVRWAKQQRAELGLPQHEPTRKASSRRRGCLCAQDHAIRDPIPALGASVAAALCLGCHHSTESSSTTG